MDAKKLALISVFAALYVAGSFLPGFPVIGMPGSKIDAVRALEIGYGLILGPIYGPIAAFLGSVVGKTLTGGGVGLFLTPLAPLTAFVAASLGRKRVSKVPGWLIASAVLIIVIAGWYSTETGREAPYYPILHVSGLMVVILFRGKIAALIHSGSSGKVALGVALCGFPATLAGHMLGNLIFIGLFNSPSALFMSILPISVTERLIITLLSTVIGAPLIIVISRVYPDLMRME
jgi:hypothetical protein